MKILVCRADGGGAQGFGHWNRMRQLAQRASAFLPVHFITDNLTDYLRVFGESSCFRLHAYTPDFLKEFAESQVVLAVDSYSICSEEWDSWRQQTDLIIQIDDFITPYAGVDYVLNAAPGLTPAQYSQLPGWAAIYTGLNYRLLDTVFAETTPVAAQERMTNILISFGGSSQAAAWKTVLNALANYSENRLKLHLAGNLPDPLLIPSDFPHEVNSYSFLKQSEMASLMARCGRAILPPSNLALEFLQVGGQLMVFQTADNQRLILNGLLAEQRAVAWSDDAFSAWLNDTGKDVTFIPLPAAETTWNRFWERVCKHLEVRLMPAGEQHLEVTATWANAPEVRSFSFDARPIPYEVHAKWFLNRIQSAAPYYIAYMGEQAVGSIRFDLDEKSGDWIISYLIAPEMHGKGLGQLVLSLGMRKLAAEQPASVRVIGMVLPQNTGSVAIFERLGFRCEVGEEHLKFFKHVL